MILCTISVQFRFDLATDIVLVRMCTSLVSAPPSIASFGPIIGFHLQSGKVDATVQVLKLLEALRAKGFLHGSRTRWVFLMNSASVFPILSTSTHLELSLGGQE